MLCQSAAFGGVFSGFSIAADFQFGFGRRLLLATRTAARSSSATGSSPVRATITIGVVTLVGLGVGMNIDGGGLDVFGMYWLAAMINITGLLFAAGVALRFRSLQATPLMQVPVFLFLFLALVYVLRELLGGWVDAVAPFNPATHVMETVRDLVAGQGSEYLTTLAAIVALLAVVTIFMFRGLRQAEAGASGHPPSSPLRAVISKQLLRMESSGLGRPPFTDWSQASRPSCILTCGKDSNSLNPSIPNAGDVKDRKGNLGFALRAPGVVSEAGKYFVAGVHYLHHFNAEMTHVLRKLLGLPHDGLPPTGNPARHEVHSGGRCHSISGSQKSWAITATSPARSMFSRA